MHAEQRIRGFLFYTSVLIFLIGLPFIFSFALGYKFDRAAFKFRKTGIIFLRTQPAGASIYLDDSSLGEKTPATIRELLPKTYRIRIELEKYNPWYGFVKVEPGKVTLLDKIILFSLAPDIRQINKTKFNYFWEDKERDLIYYVNYADSVIYSSDFQGAKLEKLCSFLRIEPPALKWKISHDRLKLLYFNQKQIGVISLEPAKENVPVKPPFIIGYSNGRIIDAFWHSDNFHIIVVSDKNIEVMEAKPQSALVVLAQLNKRDTSAFYNLNEDALYFVDYQTEYDGTVSENLYKLELNVKNSFFGNLIKPKINEQHKEE